MKTNFFLLVLFCISTSTFYAQKWARNTESEFVNEAMDIEIDNLGNIYITGYYTGEMAFQIGEVFPNAPGNGDIYVAKYSPAGVLIWKKRFGGNFSDRAYDLVLDNQNNIIITGQFFGTVNFDGVTISSAGNSKDIFLAKLDNSGVTLWARAEGGPQAENAYGVAVDNNDNVILTGQYLGNSTLGDQSFTSQINPVTGLYSYDLFVSKYSSSGVPAWVTVGNAKYEDRGLAVDTDDDGNVYLTGQFSDTLVFANTTFNNNAYNLGFVAKLNPDGTLNWFNRIQGGLVLAYDLEVSEQTIHVVGDCKNNLIYQNGNSPQTTTSQYDNSIFNLKINLNGTFDWCLLLNSLNQLSARSVSLDADKNVYITGSFSCSWTQFHTPASPLFNSVGFRDAYLWKTLNSGTLAYVKTFGGTDEDMGHGVAIKPNGEAVICGSYMQNMHYPNVNGDISFGNYTMNYTQDPTNNINYFSDGDSSSNSFITNAIDDASVDYNYFVNMSSDSLFGNIVPDLDTVNFCFYDYLTVNPHTYELGGPAYNFTWSNGSTEQSTYVNASGSYSVFWERNDECASGTDTIVVIIHQLPDLPTMTDNLGLAIQEPGPYYYEYNYCFPDSVTLWFNDLPDSTTISIYSGVQQFNDTLPHTYFDDVEVLVSNQYCTIEGWVDINFEYATPYSYSPYLVLEDTLDFNDSITVCANQSVLIQNLDFNNNPNGVFYLFPSQQPYDIAWTITTNGLNVSNGIVGSNEYHRAFIPPSTGWYVVNVQSITGYNNLCGLDTTHYLFLDSFYVEVLPLPIPPAFSIQGDNLLCPNGSVYLVVNPTIPSYTWYGPGVEWVSVNGDSAQVSAAGPYSYAGVLMNPVTGCAADSTWASYLLQEKEPPGVTTNPNDAVICPFDTVTFTVNDIFVSYEWFGPEGIMPSTTNTEQGTEQGFYYVTVVDDEGCALTSLPAELTEYATPYLMVLPSNVLCEGETATIEVISFGDVQINWINPSGSTASEIVVDQAGWYSCQLTQCGITVLDSIEIIDGTFSLSLTYSDSILCFDQDVVLSTTPGLSDYQWNNPEVYGSSVIIEEEGAYFVTAVNGYGCEATSDTAFFTEIVNSEPPAIEDTFTCIQGNVLILNNLSASWFTMDSVLISTGASFEPNIESDTVFLVSYAPAECPVVYKEFQVDFIQDIPNFDISGDSIICIGSPLDLSVNTTFETVNWFLNGISVGEESEINLASSQIDGADSIYVLITSPCYSDTVTYFFQEFEVQPLTLNQDSIYLCEPAEINLTSLEGYSEIIWEGTFGTENTSALVLPIGFPAGTVYAQGIDVNGCQTLEDSIEIAYASNVTPPTFDTINICVSGEVELTNVDLINWYSIDSVFIENAQSLAVNVVSDTSFLASYAPSGCPVQFSEVVVQFIQNVPQYGVLGDTLLCAGQDLELSTDALTETLNWIHDGFSVGSAATLTLDNSLLSNNELITLIISNPCYSDTLYQSVNVLAPQSINLDFDTVVLCPRETEVVTLQENYPTVTWSDGVNEYETSELELNTINFMSGYFSVSAVDSNGCITDSDNFLLIIPSLEVSIDVNYGLNCVGDSLQFIANSSSDSILWITPFGNSVEDTINLLISGLTEGSYVLQSWDENECLFSTETFFTAATLPSLMLPEDTVLCSSVDLPVTLSNSDFSFEWLSNDASTSIINGNSGLYYYNLIGTNGCSIQDSIFLTLANCEDELPNVFTPNGDGVNDYFIIDEALMYPSNQLIISNRWGQVVLKTSGYRNDFGGENLTEGVYFYTFHQDYVNEPNRFFEGFFHIVK